MCSLSFVIPGGFLGTIRYKDSKIGLIIKEKIQKTGSISVDTCNRDINECYDNRVSDRVIDQMFSILNSLLNSAEDFISLCPKSSSKYRCIKIAKRCLIRIYCTLYHFTLQDFNEDASQSKYPVCVLLDKNTPTDIHEIFDYAKAICIQLFCVMKRVNKRYHQYSKEFLNHVYKLVLKFAIVLDALKALS